MATNPIDPIDQDIDIPPAPPEGIYDADFRNKVIALLAWFKTMAIQFTTFIEKLNIWTNQVNNLSQKIEAAAAVGELVNYTGEHVEGNSYSPPTIVSKDGIFYQALRTTDTTPPSADWTKIEIVKGKIEASPFTVVKRDGEGKIKVADAIEGNEAATLGQLFLKSDALYRDETSNREFDVIYSSDSEARIIIIWFNISGTSTKYFAIDIEIAGVVYSFDGVGSESQRDAVATVFIPKNTTFKVSSGQNAPELTKWVEVY